MEFFFLTQDIYLEVIVFVLLLIVLGVIWGNRFFVWIKGIYETLTAMKLIRRNHQKILQKIPPLRAIPKETLERLPSKVENNAQDSGDAIGSDTVKSIEAPEEAETLEEGKILEVTGEMTEPVDDEPDSTKSLPGDQTIEEIQSKEIKKPKKTVEKSIPVPEKIDTSHVEKISQLISSARTLMARGMPIEAKTLIIEGLSIEKDNRDLNFLLGTLYEQDGQYDKAEYIYKDMVELHPNDLETLERLANVLIIEKKYTIASEIYKKIYITTGNTETTLYMLTHISNTLDDHTNTLMYAKKYVLQWPKNPEIITLLATVQIKLGHRKDAIDTYKHLKNLTPYSSEITEILQKLLIEEELANNFADK